MSCSPTGVVGLRVAQDAPEATVSGWIDGHDTHSVAAGFHGYLFGHEFRAFVVSNHVGERDGRIFVGGMAVPGESYGRDTRGVHHGTNAVLARGLENRASAFDIRAIHFRGIAQPEPVVGGHVKHHFAARHRLFERGGIAKIAGGGFGLQALDILQVAGGAYEQAEVGSLLG